MKRQLTDSLEWSKLSSGELVTLMCDPDSCGPCGFGIGAAGGGSKAALPLSYQLRVMPWRQAIDSEPGAAASSGGSVLSSGAAVLQLARAPRGASGADRLFGGHCAAECGDHAWIKLGPVSNKAVQTGFIRWGDRPQGKQRAGCWMEAVAAREREALRQRQALGRGSGGSRSTSGASGALLAGCWSPSSATLQRPASSRPCLNDASARPCSCSHLPAAAGLPGGAGGAAGAGGRAAASAPWQRGDRGRVAAAAAAAAAGAAAVRDPA